MIFVGEQPGDAEDLAGQPFVGPAGRLLDRAMAEAGIPRQQAYVTNAVKHFKWEPRGKRRIHQKPSEAEIEACNPWLLAEAAVVRPEGVVCMGVTAARAAFGRAVRLRDQRGSFTATRLCRATFVTIHPSALLRLRGDDERHAEYARFVADLAQVAGHLAG